MDIVEWLRQLKMSTANADWNAIIVNNRLDEAADEIERLRKALQEIADWPDYRLPSHQEIARAALKETE